MAVDPLTFRRVAGRFATGVTVVTTVVGSEHHGMTANSFTTVSLDPPLVLVSVDRQARFHSAVLAAGCYGVSVLSAGRHETARWFATQARPRDELQFGAFPHRLEARPAWCSWTTHWPPSSA